MAVSFVGYNSAAATSCSLPSFNVGDLALCFAYRDGNNTAPSLPGGWTSIAFSGANSNSSRVGYRVLASGDTTTGVWTNATEVQVCVVRGQRISDPLGDFRAGGANGSVMEYEFFGLEEPGGTSFLVGFAGHRTATNVNSTDVSSVAAWDLRSSGSATSSLGCHTQANAVDATAGGDWTVNASSGWRTYQVEVLPELGTPQTGTAQISLAPGQVPETRTNHTLNVRASGSGVLRVQLYEGASARSAVLEATLTGSLADYPLAIDDAEAATIVSYSNLEVRLYGYGAGTYEVADVSLLIPSPAAGDVFGTVSQAYSFNRVTNGVATSSGDKSTGYVQVSLGTGAVPATRTDHDIVVRARVQNGAHTGQIKAQLYEGSTPIGTELTSSNLTGSLAEYVLSVAAADAATITDYSNLTLYLRGYASTGDAATFEIANAKLTLPASSTGGAVTGAAVLSSAATVFALALGGAGGPIYPSGSLFPYSLITLSSAATVTASSTHVSYGAVSLPLVFNRITDGTYPPGNREGKVLLTSTATITVAAAGAGDTLGAALLDSVATITVGSVQDVTGAALLASTVSITAAGVDTDALVPPGFVDQPEFLPDLQVAIAFDTAPLDPFQAYESVTEYVRGINSKRGRQFELDRVEAGQESFLLSNLDGRFNPDNAAGPYYPNLKPTRRVRWTMRWNSVNYDLFVGFLEGYPQQFPHFGYDRVVSQKAIDGFMALAVAKLIPATTTLTDNLAVTTADASETVGVSSTTLPMPQTVPFEITIGTESMTVTAIASNQTYLVSRTAIGSEVHAVGDEVTTDAVSFGEEYTGTRIANVLAHVNLGIPTDIDAGQTLLAPSENLAGQSPLEHLLLVAEVESGRLFSARDGTLTFHQRHRFYADEKTDRAVFGNGAGELPYQDVEVTHDDAKIFNIVRITAADGTTYEVRDQGSIDDHFERVYEKSWPLADANEAKDAAEYLLSRLSRMQVRIPNLQITGMSDPTDMWPTVLALDLGQRFGFKLRPEDGSQMIDKSLVVEGVAHNHSLSEMRTAVQFSLADTTHYWQLEVAGYSELNDTTKLAY